ncbi:MAG TPA: hypothetical protein VNR00_18375 [Opitutus sp.]|nr:hypothetical protein [Opitutus sp.]
MNRTWKIVLAFVGVFLAGAIFGAALAPRLMRTLLPERRQPFQERMMERLDEELHLTAEQKQKIAPIVQRMAEETQRMRREGAITYRTVMEGLNEEIALELTPEQRAKHEEMRRKLRERMEQYRGRSGFPGR